MQHIIEQLEKEQIKDAYVKGQSDCEMFTMESEAEQYYNNTYNNDNSHTNPHPASSTNAR